LSLLLVAGCWLVVMLSESAQSRDEAPRTSNQQQLQLVVMLSWW
jgi:hypothetical protein